MHRYFFDVNDAKGYHRDAFGDEFPGIEDAQAQCRGLILDLMRDELPDGDLHTIRCDGRVPSMDQRPERDQARWADLLRRPTRRGLRRRRLRALHGLRDLGRGSDGSDQGLEKKWLLIESMPARHRDEARSDLQCAIALALIAAATNGVDAQGRPDFGF